MAVAGLEEDEEINAEGPARRGMRAVDGLAARGLVSYWWRYRV